MKKRVVLLLVMAILMSIVTACGLDEDTSKSDSENEVTDRNQFEENDSSILTIDTCPDLEAVLFSKEASGEEFASKYDGACVEFNACIYKNEKSSITLDRSITVTGEFNDAGEASGWVIMIGNRTWGANIDESVEKGDLVLVRGTVNAEWTEYYNCLYIETDSLTRVN